MELTKKSSFLLNVLVFLTFDLMLLGAGVRTMDAGLTCPDWPLCFGKTVPEYHFGVYLEFIHRVIAGLVGLIYLVFLVQVWRSKSLKKIRILSLVGFFFLIAQIVMGGLTVLKLLEAYIVTLHLSLATIFLLTLYIMKKRLAFDPEQRVTLKQSFWTRVFKVNLSLGLVFVLVQIVLGGLVASTYSGLVCIDFPTCNGQLFPEMVGPIAIQMFHRFGAYWLSLLILSLFLISFFYAPVIGLSRKQIKLSVLLLAIICGQVLVGVLNLRFLMPAYLSVFHLALALSLMLVLTNLFYSYRR